jgi:hypothetical protein
MSEELKPQKTSLLRNLAFDLLDSEERKLETKLLLDEFLPHLAVDIENDMSNQRAVLFYEIFTENYQPKIRVVLRLPKFEHEFIIHLDSTKSMFVIGSERGGQLASSALNATMSLKVMLLKLRV